MIAESLYQRQERRIREHPKVLLPTPIASRQPEEFDPELLDGRVQPTDDKFGEIDD
jgi:hypothetical protein